MVAIASGLSFLHVRSGLERQALDQLKQYVQERRARESAIFELAEDNLATFVETYLGELRRTSTIAIDDRFDALFETRPDGTVRLREQIFERSDTTGFIGRYTRIDDDLRKRLVVAYDVLDRFGPAWRRQFVNLYVITPEQAALMSWPDQPWALNASDWEVAGKLELVAPPSAEWGIVVLDETARPAGRRWSDLYFDYGVNDWLVSVTEPVVAGERHLLSVGHDILLRELIARTLASEIEGTYEILVARDGRLIAHPEYMEAIQATSGALFVEQTGDEHLVRTLERARDLPEGTLITENAEDGEFLAVSRIDGPGWLLITVFPRAIVSSQAFETAWLILVLGLIALVVELLILAFTLRKQVARPLTGLIEATRQLAAGRFDARLATDRQDELGALARSFEQMAHEVRDREQALSERSALLAEVNAKLARELTERARVEAEVARQREALHQSEKLNALGSLLAGVAHELNNPLAVVVGRASMLEEQLRQRPEGRTVGKIREAAERCAKIVRTFIQMARRQEPARRRVAISELLESTLEMVGFGLRRDGIELELDLPDRLPSLAGDPNQLVQVFTNLLVNAQHALAGRPEPRRVRVGGRQVGAELVIEIADNGPGIPAEIASRIFDPFFTTKPQGQGTGLGLSVCRGMIEAHDGSLDVRSEAGAGATFTIRLPIDVAPPAAGDAPSPAGPAGGSVLVVEDEPDIRELLRDVLAAAGLMVETAESGREALNRLEQTTYDVILSDLRMPDLDGPGLFRMLAARDPALAERLVFVTGDSLSESVAAFLAESGRPAIEKPFAPEDVRRVVQAELARVRSRSAAAEPVQPGKRVSGRPRTPSPRIRNSPPRSG